MEHLLNDILQYLLPKGNIFLYIFLFLSAVVENLFPPIPGDTITALGAFLVGTGRLSYGIVYVTTTAGSVIGFMALFFLGKFLEKEYFMKKNYKFFTIESIESAEHWFSKYGYFVVLANRFLPGIRSVISIVSGISKLSTLKVFIFSLISASIWNLIWIHVGFVLGNNWEVVKSKMKEILLQYNIAAGIILTTILIVFLIVKFIKKKNLEK